MNIQELSVGDWVRYRDREWQVCSLYQFTEEVGLWRKDSQVCETITDIQPIPLTVEILEKNGFILDKPTRWHICKVSDDTKIDVWIGRTGQGRIEVSRADVFYPECYFKYADIKCLNIAVHTLQHALRLAGIVKEIEL